jgi:hypothetical protein
VRGLSRLFRRLFLQQVENAFGAGKRPVVAGWPSSAALDPLRAVLVELRANACVAPLVLVCDAPNQDRFTPQ